MSGAGHPNPVVRHLREGLRSPLPLTRMASSTSRLPRGTCYSVPLVSIAVRQDRAAYRSSTACVPACLRACLLACLPRGFLKPPSAPPRRRLSGFAKPPRPVAIPRHFRETAPPSRYPPPPSLRSRETARRPRFRETVPVGAAINDACHRDPHCQARIAVRFRESAQELCQLLAAASCFREGAETHPSHSDQSTPRFREDRAAPPGGFAKALRVLTSGVNSVGPG